MSTPSSPARLHVLLAADAPIGLVIRRGPSKQVCTLLWDRRKDTFTLGQWLKGRIYEHRSDLSPDGKYFLYFAMNARRSRKGPPCWTAVSRTPWLRAIALYGDEETWLGGGRFLDQRVYSVNGGPLFHVIHESAEVRRKLPDPNAPVIRIEEAAQLLKYPLTGDLGVYLPRLERDGWTMIEKIKTGERSDAYAFEKGFSNTWTLRKIVHEQINPPIGKGVHWEEQALLNPGAGLSIPCPDWEWLELDGSRLVWATGGKLWTGTLGATELEGIRELYDFNNMEFQEIKAPYV